MEKWKSLGVDEIPEELTPEEFENFDDTVAATEPVLPDESILAMAREVKEPVEVESDEEGGEDTIEAYFKRIAIETLMDFSFFMESEEMQRNIKISALIENKLSKNLKQASIKDYFG